MDLARKEEIGQGEQAQFACCEGYSRSDVEPPDLRQVSFIPRAAVEVVIVIGLYFKVRGCGTGQHGRPRGNVNRQGAFRLLPRQVCRRLCRRPSLRRVEQDVDLALVAGQRDRRLLTAPRGVVPRKAVSAYTLTPGRSVRTSRVGACACAAAVVSAGRVVSGIHDEAWAEDRSTRSRPRAISFMEGPSV